MNSATLRSLVFWISTVCVLGWIGTRQASAGDRPQFDTYEQYADALTGGDPVTRLGMDTWFQWTAGNQAFWGRAFPIATHGEVDLLRLLDARVISREERFEELGVINDPSCVAPTQPDEFGFLLDVCTEPQSESQRRLYGEPTGIIGLRKFPNPGFDPVRWNRDGGALRYLSQDKESFDPTLQPPYVVGISCAVCHVAFDPLNPPSDPADPAWENLAPAVGNQYLDEAAVFTLGASPHEFRWQAGRTQAPGTSDTSRITNDFINNPTAINPVFGLEARLRLRTFEAVSGGQADFLRGMVARGVIPPEEFLDSATPQILTAHGLIDGADSVGLPLASLRVYANIGGLDLGEFLQSLPTAENGYAQNPFDIAAARDHPSGLWRATVQFLPAMQAFLVDISDPMPLSQAPGGAEYLDEPPDVVRRGRILFARNCAECHSSKHPDPSITDPESRLAAYEALVLSPDFLVDNFLSDDRRHPITELQTNAARSLSTNATAGQIWESFSSETYKELPSAGRLESLHNPLSPRRPISMDLPAGGPGYSRTPTLISMWATAPYLHNNSLGDYVKDPSVEGRMEAFHSGVRQLLWPETRRGLGSIKRTERASILTDSLGNPVMVPRPNGNVSPFVVPARTPVNLFAHLHPSALPAVVGAYARGGPRVAMLKALELNRVPDFVEDRGHDYGTNLSDRDKWALIAFLKRL